VVCTNSEIVMKRFLLSLFIMMFVPCLSAFGQAPNYGSGFASTTGLTLNGFGSAAATNSSHLRLTDGGAYEARSVFFSTPVNVQSFTNDFTFLLTKASADGFTFTIQGIGPTALGAPGGALGYGANSAGTVLGIGSSVAVGCQLYSKVLGNIEVSLTGDWTNGAAPSATPGSNTTASGVNLHSGDVMSVHMTYDGTTLTWTITDSTVGKSFTKSVTVNIPSFAGNTAYVGFTGGTGALTAIQDIRTWTYTPGNGGPPPQQVATPTFNPIAGTYSSTQMVSILDTTAGSTIYYTTDSSTPTTSSAQFTVPISVSSTMTIKSMAAANGMTNSSVAAALYTIQPAGGGGAPSYWGGFTSSGLTLNGFGAAAAFSGTHLRLTDGGANEGRSAFFSTPVNVQSFTNDFTFVITKTSQADGLTFTIQGIGPNALGAPGSGLGYGQNTAGTIQGIGNSIAVGFQLYSKLLAKEVSLSGYWTNGASPSLNPGTDTTASGVNLHSGDVMNVHMTYDGTKLTWTLTDPTVGKSVTDSVTISIPSLTQSSTAYVGFTGGSGSLTAVQDILKWNFVPASGGAPSLLITTTSLPNGQVGIAYNAALSATGGTAPYRWSFTSGTLPTGLSLNASTGAITGTPTQSVTNSPLTFQVVDSANHSMSLNFTLTIGASGGVTVSISPKRAGLTITQTLSVTATTNDAAGVNWSATGGGLSAGSSLSAVPVTYTPPATAGSYTITATSVSNGTISASITVGVTDLAGVLTYHNDLSRDGANTREYTLTPSLVKTSTFAKLFSCTADGAIYAQPLWVPNVSIGGGRHNIIIAATMRDSVYAFDADVSPCVTYWHMTLIPSGETYGSYEDVGSENARPDIGILGTPVIDGGAGTVFVVTKTKTTSTTYFQRLHALSLSDGSERTNSPVQIDRSISVPGNCEGGSSVSFNPLRENQRPGLALVNGVVYISWASHGDNDPYHGWIMGYNAANLSPVAVYNTSPNAAESLPYCRAGIWMAGGAPAADSSNNLYLLTGNGIWNGTNAFGDSALKFSTSSGLTVADWFTPYNQLNLDGNDFDVGSGGAAVLIDSSGPHPQLLIGGGKEGILYVLDRTNMGHNHPSDNSQIVQTLTVTGGTFSTPAFWKNTLFHIGTNTSGKAYTFNPSASTFTAGWTSQTAESFGPRGATPSVSANGNSNGIVWVIDASNYGTTTQIAAGPAILRAYDATNLATEFWNSSMVAGDKAGNAVRFTVPTVANGKVYIGTRGNDTANGSGTVFGEIDVYGLKPN